MATVGIIAEYNPFHRGHEWQIAQLRRQLGENTDVACVMSGNFVQRGDCAILPKHDRAAAALRGGANLVLELPLTWATASAERFARGGVEVLKSTGVTERLVFGSETGDLAGLSAAADAVDEPTFPDALRPWLDGGLSFAEARQKAVEEILGRPWDLSQPNDLLGVEYLRALRGSAISPVAIRRKGAGHHQVGTGDITSASDIRRRLLAGEPVCSFLPTGEQEPETERLASLAYNERGVLTRLKTMRWRDFLRLPDCGDGLERRMEEAARKATSLEEVYSLAKTRRFAHARIRRLVLWSYLGLTEEDFAPHVPYIRVLGMDERGRELLHRMKQTATLPVLTKPAAVRRMDEACQRQFALESKADDLYLLCRRSLVGCEGGEAWRQGPIVSFKRK